MATDTRNLPAFLSNDADFRTWVQGIQAQLAVAGMVKTADTGQINSATVARPGVINTAAGYEVYRFDDALQATRPVFFKLEYGVGGAVDRPAIWLTAGSSSDGAGAINGLSFLARVQRAAAGSKPAATLVPSYCSGEGGRLALITNHDTSTFTIGFLIERARLFDGTAVEGLMVFSFSSGAYSGSVVRPDLGSVFTGIAALPGVLATYQNSQSSVAPNVALVPPIQALGGRLVTWPFLIYETAVLSGVAAVVVDGALGGSHTFLTVGGGMPTVITAGYAPAILWE
jgi:hypothetical protein